MAAVAAAAAAAAVVQNAVDNDDRQQAADSIPVQRAADVTPVSAHNLHTNKQTNNPSPIRDVWKTEIRCVFGFKNLTVQNFDIRSDGFPIVSE